MQHKFVCLCGGGNCSPGVVDLVPLAAAGVEIVRKVCRSFSQRQLRTLEGDPVMTRDTCYAKAGTCNGHFCSLKRRIVGSGEAPVL